jgi:hypothetical protein
MARLAKKLHLLTVREVQTATDGDHTDGGGLLLRVRGESASWVLRYTSPAGRRREMGLGPAHRGSAAQAGQGLTAARDQGHKARELLRQGRDPIDERDGQRAAAQAAEQAKKKQAERSRWTLARAARDFHERVIEPSRTTKHAAQWIASLGNHMPAALWHKPIDEIDAPELLQALNAIKPHERARNLTKNAKVAETVQRIRQRLDSVFEDATFTSDAAPTRPPRSGASCAKRCRASRPASSPRCRTRRHRRWRRGCARRRARQYAASSSRC